VKKQYLEVVYFSLIEFRNEEYKE